jgi:hypothetical protein
MTEACGQSTMRAKRPRLDRPERDTEPFGDLRMGEPLEVVEFDELAFVGG